MNIALIGYGNMGREIEKLLVGSKEHRIVSISFDEKQRSLDVTGIAQADVAIDFTSSEIVLQHIDQVMELSIPLVVGTTGWSDQLAQVKRLVKKTNGALIYGGNFSIGANIFQI